MTIPVSFVPQILNDEINEQLNNWSSVNYSYASVQVCKDHYCNIFKQMPRSVFLNRLYFYNKFIVHNMAINRSNVILEQSLNSN